MTSVLDELSVPAGWHSAPFGRLVSRSKEFGRPDLPPLSVYLDDGVVLRSSRDDNHNRLGEDVSKYLVVRPGDVVFNKLRTWQGGLGASRHHGIVSPAYYVCRPRPSAEPRFLHYLLRSRPYLSEFTRVSKFMPPSQFDILWDDLRLVPVRMPSFPQQRAIADYLDTETARIDALIAKKQTLATTLEQRFLEATRHRVTGALTCRDPLLVLRSELHHGWMALKLGRHLTFGSGTTPPSGNNRFYGPGTPWLVTGDLRDRDVTEIRRFVTQRALVEFSALKVHPAGSLVVAMYGATVGRLGLLTSPATVNQACAVIHPTNEVDLRYLFLYLLAHRDALLQRSVGAGQPNISQDILRSLSIAVPAVEEQARIADELLADRQRNRDVIGTLQRQLRLLREHRQALITAAVTGELDVPARSA